MKIFCALILACSLFVAVKAQSSPFVGITTAVYNGSMISFFYDNNGYDDLKNACDKEFAGTHVCTAHELGIIAQCDSKGIGGKGSFRYLDMSFARNGGQPNQPKLNDCKGFTTANNMSLSHCIVHRMGGIPLPEFCTCDKVLPLICCVDETFGRKLIAE